MSSVIGSLELVRGAKPVAIAAFSDTSSAAIVSVESIQGGYRFQMWTTSPFLNAKEKETLKKIEKFFRSNYAKGKLREIFSKPVTSLVLVGNTAKFQNEEIYQTVEKRKFLWLRRLGTAVEKIDDGYPKDALHILRGNFLEWEMNLGMTGPLTTAIKVQEGANETLPLPRNGVVFLQSEEVMFEESVLGKRSRKPADPKPLEKEPRQTEGAKIRPENWKPENGEESEIEQQVQQEPEVVEESEIKQQGPEFEEESNRWTPDTELVLHSPSSDDDWYDLRPVFAAREGE